MNRIQMYASSSHLRSGLHRVLAVSHSFVDAFPENEKVAWWSELLDEHEHEAGRTHQLGLESLADAYARERVRGVLDAARSVLDLSPLDHGALASAFRAAIVSSRAHRAHMGRDVYGASNKRVWDLACADFGRAVNARYGPVLGEGWIPMSLVPPEEAARSIRELIAFDTSPEGPDHGGCVDWLRAELENLGFIIEVHELGAAPPLLVARREAQGLAGHLVLYGHYDVTPTGDPSRWTHPPHELTVADGRLFGRGVADNKGPLGARIAALRELDGAPALTWLIQGEEETGSRAAHALLPRIMASLRAELWLDETGYHDHEDGALRLLARTLGTGDESLKPDAALRALKSALAALASRWGVAARHERRGLNKSVVHGGCPFNRNLPAGARYLAVGINDSRARIHGIDESVPAWTFALHHAELELIFRWADSIARSGV